jgi:hypothetical protein
MIVVDHIVFGYCRLELFIRNKEICVTILLGDSGCRLVVPIQPNYARYRRTALFMVGRLLK